MRKLLILLGIVLGIILGVIGVYLFTGTYVFNTLQTEINAGEIEKFEDAKLLWESRPFTDYQMKILYSYPHEEDCMRDLIFNADPRQIVLIEDTCTTSFSKYYPYTMDKAFEIMEDVLTNSWECGANGCDCDGPIRFEGKYNDRFGFLISFKADISPEENWRFQEFWIRKFVTKDGSCHLLGTVLPNFEVVSFRPIANK